MYFKSKIPLLLTVLTFDQEEIYERKRLIGRNIGQEYFLKIRTL